MPPAEKMRSAYYPHVRVTADPVGPSKTKQSMADESNINIIMARYVKTGLIDHVSKYGPRYADMPNMSDFHEAMTLVTEAQQMFEELPAEIRSNFKNDPADFLDFVTNPENEEAMIEMGLADAQNEPDAPALDPAAHAAAETLDPPKAAPADVPDPV